MARHKANPEAPKESPTVISCAICKEVIEVTEYATHVLAKHSPAPSPPIIPNSQPPSVTAPSAPMVPYSPSPSPLATVVVPHAQIPAWQSPTGGYYPQQVPITAPPPRPPRNPFVNAALLWQNGGKIAEARIIGVRPATGGNAAFGAPRGGWFLDLDIPGKGPHTARVTIGDKRHETLYARYQANWIGQTITIRLPVPADATKAQWVID